MANILIADDDPAVQITIRLLLERAGHHVTVAGDGRNGPALFEASQFDLLFLDIFMPGMDGLETMRRIRALAPAEPDFLKMATKLGKPAKAVPTRRTACRGRWLPEGGRDGGVRCPLRPPMTRTPPQGRNGAAIRPLLRISQ